MMADEDEIDVLGDFSFNSCFALNSQGIPSCSDREDTVHPQWLLDSTATNWYDGEKPQSSRIKDGEHRTLSGDRSVLKHLGHIESNWSKTEKELLVKELTKYGRDIVKLSQAIKTKTIDDIQTLLDAEHGINLEPQSVGIIKIEDQSEVPIVAQEEIIADDNVLNLSTGSPKAPKQNRNRKYSRSKNRKLSEKSNLIAINPAEILNEDDIVLGSIESVVSDDSTEVKPNRIGNKYQKIKTGKKIGNHRRKVSRNFDRGRPRNRNGELIKSSPARQRKDSNLSDDSVTSPKLQIVLGSGQALMVSEGEQVIKIEKRPSIEAESDIDIDVDSDNESKGNIEPAGKPSSQKTQPSDAVLPTRATVPSSPTKSAAPSSKFAPMPRRQKKINLDGGGGYTIMHTARGDLVRACAEPRRPRPPRRAALGLLPCRVFSADRPAPYEVHLNVSALIGMDVHAHTSVSEVMGLVGGALAAGRLVVARYRSTRAAACTTHCDMDPVSQSQAAASLQSLGTPAVGWHHSHPSFPARPSSQDLTTQLALQTALERNQAPFLSIITSQHWSPGRTASHYRCIRVDPDTSESEVPTGYQFSVKLVPDLTADNLDRLLEELRLVVREDGERNEFSVDVNKDVCPVAKLTFIDKCISSIRHHMSSAGYAPDDPLLAQLVAGIKDIFR